MVLLSFTCDWGGAQQWPVGVLLQPACPHTHKTYIFHSQFNNTLFFNTHTTLLKPLNVKVWFEDTNESPFVFVFLFYLPLSPSTSSCPYNKYFSTFSPNCMGSTFPGSFASYLIHAWVRMSSLSGQRMFFSLYVQPFFVWPHGNVKLAGSRTSLCQQAGI